MRIVIRFFARARDLAGTEKLSLELPGGVTIGELRSRLEKECPALKALLPRCAFAINDEFADDEQRIPDSAEVAMLPPVSGG